MIKSLPVADTVDLVALSGETLMICKASVLASERQTTHVQEKQSLSLGRVPTEKPWLIKCGCSEKPKLPTHYGY